MTARLTLPEKIVALHVALGDLPHAFGGAIALAYYAEPRGTVDIDLNVFVPELEAARAVAPLEAAGVTVRDGDLRRAQRDGQARLFWDTTPVDLFLSYDAFHDSAERAARLVPFADTTIPVLAPEHLVVCKVVFDRARDWVDIDAMLDAGTTIDGAETIRWVQRIVGDADPRFEHIVRVLTRRPG